MVAPVCSLGAHYSKIEQEFPFCNRPHASWTRHQAAGLAVIQEPPPADSLGIYKYPLSRIHPLPSKLITEHINSCLFPRDPIKYLQSTRSPFRLCWVFIVVGTFPFILLWKYFYQETLLLLFLQALDSCIDSKGKKKFRPLQALPKLESPDCLSLLGN